MSEKVVMVKSICKIFFASPFTYLKIYSLLMCKSSELKKFNEYFNVLIFGSLDLKNIDLEMAIRQE